MGKAQINSLNYRPKRLAKEIKRITKSVATIMWAGKSHLRGTATWVVGTWCGIMPADSAIAAKKKKNAYHSCQENRFNRSVTSRNDPTVEKALGSQLLFCAARL